MTQKERNNIPYQNKENAIGEIIVRGIGDRCDILKRIEDDTFSSVLVQDNGFRKDIIFQLAINNIPFRSVGYGAGVYRLFKEDRMSK